MYDDKLMLWNPGELPAEWTLAKLKGKHPSRPFNPDVANAFFRAGMIEAWGRGIERIIQACRAAGTPPPEFRYEQKGLWVEFGFPKPLPTSGVTPEVTGEVTGEVERLVLAIEGRMSRAEIQQALGLRHQDHFRESYLTPALQGGVVTMTFPDKPKSSRQQYRLTARGEILRAKLLKGKGA